MRKFVLTFIAFALPTAVEASYWFGKYRSRYDALMKHIENMDVKRDLNIVVQKELKMIKRFLTGK